MNKQELEKLGIIFYKDEWMTAKPKQINGVDDYSEWENNRAKAAIIIFNAYKKERLNK